MECKDACGKQNQRWWKEVLEYTPQRSYPTTCVAHFVSQQSTELRSIEPIRERHRYRDAVGSRVVACVTFPPKFDPRGRNVRTAGQLDDKIL